MSVEPASYALTTAAEFLAYLGEPSDTTGKQTDRAQRLINSYSRAILNYVKRELSPTEDGADKVFSYDGSSFLSLAPYEARTINTVTLYTDLAEAAWVVLPNQSETQAALWWPNPRQRTPEGTYLWLTLPERGRFHPLYNEPLGTSSRRFSGYQVTVNADWGVDAAVLAQSDIELALWIACANAWRNPEGYRQRSMGGFSASDYDDATMAEQEGLQLPRATRSLLYDLRRTRTKVVR